MNSAIYVGRLQHCRYRPVVHAFSYPLYMLALDLDELDQLQVLSPWLSTRRLAPLWFRRADYLGDPDCALKASVWREVARLGGEAAMGRVLMVAQLRCFGLYFSPVNFYYCYRDEVPRYLLAEVSNTPWRQSHTYLIAFDHPEPVPKAFHVSPFMGMDTRYHWQLSPPGEHLRLTIDIRDACAETGAENLFGASLDLQRQPLQPANVRALLLRWPWMSASILRAIYWQALQLAWKRVPFHPHPNS